MAREEEDVARTYVEYFEKFGALRPDAVSANFDVPCMFLTSQGSTMLASADAVERFLHQLMGGLKERGFGRSEISDMRVKQLSHCLALINVRGVRYRMDDSVLEKIGTTNTLRKTDTGWKIVQIAVHDPDVVIAI